jgi:S-adenosylmethionine hydrolase
VSGGEGVFIGPDNGLLATGVALAGGAEYAVELTNTKYHLPSPGTTFAGRDIFASVAAHICNGVELSELGNEIDTASILPGIIPITREENGQLVGEVTWVDHFGNCQLNIGPEDLVHLGPVLRLVIGEDVRSARMTTHFADIDGGAIGAVTDSYGMVALAVDRGSAAEVLRVGAGDGVYCYAGQVDSATSAVSIRPAK